MVFAERTQSRRRPSARRERRAYTRNGRGVGPPFTAGGGAPPLHTIPAIIITPGTFRSGLMNFSPGGQRLFVVRAASALLLAAGCAACLVSSTAAEPAKTGRTPWTTSRVVGSPDPPPPFKVVRAFPKLKFEHPLLLARPPIGDRLFVGEQAGVLYSFV